MLRKIFRRVIFNTWDKATTEGKFGVYCQYLPFHYFKFRMCFYWFSLVFYIDLFRKKK